MGRRSPAVRCDVTDRDEVDGPSAALADFGAMDILINNAGTLDHAAQSTTSRRTSGSATCRST